MSVIQANQGVVTQINVFTVTPEKQEALIELLKDAAEFASGIPGGFRPISIGV